MTIRIRNQSDEPTRIETNESNKSKQEPIMVHTSISPRRDSAYHFLSLYIYIYIHVVPTSGYPVWLITIYITRDEKEKEREREREKEREREREYANLIVIIAILKTRAKVYAGTEINSFGIARRRRGGVGWIRLLYLSVIYMTTRDNGRPPFYIISRIITCSLMTLTCSRARGHCPLTRENYGNCDYVDWHVGRLVGLRSRRCADTGEKERAHDTTM